MTPETVSGSDSNSNDCSDDSNRKLNSFRVRNVNEINSAVGDEENASGSDLKRKLPNWLQSPEDITKKAKRTSTNHLDPCTSTQSERNSCAEGSDTLNRIVDSGARITNVQENVLPDTSDKLKENDCLDPQSAVNASEASTTEAESCTDNCDEINAEIGEGNSSDEEEKDIKHEIPSKFTKADINEAESSHPDNEETLNVEQTDSNEADGREVKIKVEDISSSSTVNQSTASPVVNQRTASPVVKQEASSSLRDSCQYGIRCYRRNPLHRVELAHPGDQDYRRPDYPTPPLGTPACPFGDRCYRRNPVHFQQFSHPESTDFKKNWRDHKNRLRKRQNKVKYNVDLSDEDSNDLDDPFINDISEDEYVPSDDSESSCIELSQDNDN